MDNLFNKFYDATSKYVDRNKGMVGGIVVAIILVWFARCTFDNDSDCNESIIDMSKSYDRECYSGAKLKHVNDQWICSCEK